MKSKFNFVPKQNSQHCLLKAINSLSYGDKCFSCSISHHMLYKDNIALSSVFLQIVFTFPYFLRPTLHPYQRLPKSVCQMCRRTLDNSSLLPYASQIHESYL